MKLSAIQIKELCARNGMSIQGMLKSAGVSRTAYYSLLRRSSVLPGSIAAIAGTLGVTPSSVLEEQPAPTWKAQARIRKMNSILRKNPGASFENVWHTLVLLEESPVERLRRSLLRGRAHHLH